MKKVNIILAAFLVLISLTGCVEDKQTANTGRWSEEKALEWQQRTGWLSGCNFQPSTAVNQLEMWQEATFDPETINKELGWAAELGFNIMRVYLHSYAWKQDPEGFNERLDRYLTIADSHGIGTMLVFFDDCWNPVSHPGLQPEPKPGVHNSQWVQDPSTDLRDDTTVLYKWLEVYIKDVIGKHRDDPRVLVWDLYNEPGNEGHGNSSLPLLKHAFRWARDVNPEQPLTAGIWRLDLVDLNKYQFDHSDIITYHQYHDSKSHKTWLKLLKISGRPMICTEYMARHFDSRFQTIMPMLKKEQVGAINWGLVTGKTNTRYKWSEPIPDGSEPPLWFHDIFRQDGEAYDQAEIEVIKKLNTAD